VGKAKFGAFHSQVFISMALCLITAVRKSSHLYNMDIWKNKKYWTATMD